MIAGLIAIDDAGGMGFQDKLPWPKNNDDMRWFQQMTRHQVIVMGRKTWDSTDMPNPLPNRISVVVTSRSIDNITTIDGNVCEHLIELSRYYVNKNIIVIGGKNLITQSLPILDTIYITHVCGIYPSDTTFDVTVLDTYKTTLISSFPTGKIMKYSRT